MSAAAPNKIPPKPQKATIYLEADDDITSIIEKVESAEPKVVALVLPKRATSLQSIVNMRLLKRNADKAGKSVVLITSDASLMPLAGAAMLHTAKNLQSKPEIPAAPSGRSTSEESPAVLPEDSALEGEDEEAQNTKLDYHRSVGELAVAHEILDDESITLDEDEDSTSASEPPGKNEKMAKDKKTKVPNFDKFRMTLGLGGILLVGLVAFLIMAIWVLPKAVVTVQTESIPITADFTLNASESAKSLDMDKMIIPISTKTTQQTSTQTITATGQQNNGEKASGSVTLSLTDCSQSSVTIPAGTGLSSNGLTFVTQSSVSLQSVIVGGVCKNSSFPSVSSGSTTAKAQSGGAKYNIGPSSFSVSGFPGVSGSSSGSMSGGTDNITTVVAQADLDNAKQKVTSADTDKFTQDYEKKLSDEGFYVLTATLKQSEPATTSNPAVGQPASSVAVTIQITYTVQVVQSADLTKAVTYELNKQINPKKQKLSTDDVLKDANISVQNAASPSDIKIDVSQTAAAIPIIDTAAIQKSAAGKKSGEIKTAISSTPGVKSVDVKMSPFWVSKAPKKYTKVTVVVKPVSTPSTTKSKSSNAP